MRSLSFLRAALRGRLWMSLNRSCSSSSNRRRFMSKCSGLSQNDPMYTRATSGVLKTLPSDLHTHDMTQLYRIDPVRQQNWPSYINTCQSAVDCPRTTQCKPTPPPVCWTPYLVTYIHTTWPSYTGLNQWTDTVTYVYCYPSVRKVHCGDLLWYKINHRLFDKKYLLLMHYSRSKKWNEQKVRTNWGHREINSSPTLEIIL